MVQPSQHGSVADVGCNHGLLAIALANSGRAACVLATDSSPNAIKITEGNIHSFCTAPERISTRLGDGLLALGSEGCEQVAMAGLGVPRLQKILSECGTLARSARALILQPIEARATQMIDLRSSLHTLGFAIADERFAVCEGRAYLTLRAEARPEGEVASASLPCESDLLLGAERFLEAHVLQAGYLECKRTRTCEPTTMPLQTAPLRTSLNVLPALRRTHASRLGSCNAQTWRHSMACC